MRWLRALRSDDPGKEASAELELALERPDHHTRALVAAADAPETPEHVRAATAMEAVQGADALVIMTEWKAFRSPDFAELKRSLKTPVIFDGRNLYEPAVVRSHGFEYYPIGRGGAEA